MDNQEKARLGVLIAGLNCMLQALVEHLEDNKPVRAYQVAGNLAATIQTIEEEFLSAPAATLGSMS